MSPRPIQELPPGFDEMSREDQIDYVQRLWNRIADDEAEISVPEWHRVLLRARTATESSDGSASWEEVKRRLQSRSDD